MRKTWDFLDVGAHERHIAEWVVVLLILATGFVSGLMILHHISPPPCGMGQPVDHCEPQTHPNNERWDQGYLDTFSAPCPAVYDAPNGNLRECL